MANTPDGQNIGLAYFRERGINEAMIKRFHLGYALENVMTCNKPPCAKGSPSNICLKPGYVTAPSVAQCRTGFAGV